MGKENDIRGRQLERHSCGSNLQKEELPEAVKAVNDSTGLDRPVPILLS
jgi:hypothetical protein